METRVRALVEGFDNFIGIDHHKKMSYITVRDREGNIVKRGAIPTKKDALSLFLGNNSQEGAKSIAVIEAGRCYRPM